MHTRNHGRQFGRKRDRIDGKIAHEYSDRLTRGGIPHLDGLRGRQDNNRSDSFEAEISKQTSNEGKRGNNYAYWFQIQTLSSEPDAKCVLSGEKASCENEKIKSNGG
jgi:hypothetical protein